jgi:putative transcriptional regulator
LAKALLETAKDMRWLGLMDKATPEKITDAYIAADEARQPITGDDIRALRERANMPQAIFAHYLNLTVGYLSQSERGAKRPTATALVALNVTCRKGIDIIV